MTFKMPRNLMAAVSVVAFAALLSSCGGSGSGDPVAAAPPPTKVIWLSLRSRRQRAAATAATDALRRQRPSAQRRPQMPAEMARKNLSTCHCPDRATFARRQLG